MALELKPTEASAGAYDRVALVKDFLNRNYEIKINVFDPAKTIIEAKDKTMYITTPTLNDISLHMEMENIRGCDSILKKLLASPNHIKSFNPITDYLNDLKGKWKGESQIDKICSCVVARDFGDKPDGYYQERFTRIFRKWLVACVACSLGKKENDVMFGLVHQDEGIGKTGFIRFLVPKSLKSYYRQSSKDDRHFNMTDAFAKNFIINFDEFYGITKNNAEEVKQTLSSTEYVLSIRNSNGIARMGNGAFTSNKNKEMGGFLHASLGYRRWGTVEIEAIDWKRYIETVDVDQMWAEAYVLYQNADFDYVWNMDDFNEFKEYNRRYMVETNAFKLIKEWYRKPTEEDTEAEIVFKQPIDIIRELRDARKITSSMNDISDVTVGMALKALGFERRGKKIDKINARYGYNVIKLY